MFAEVPETGESISTNTYLMWVGQALIISGTVIGIVGAVFNAYSVLYHYTAIYFWCVSNAALFIWAIGFITGKWNTKMSVGWIAIMYVVYLGLNLYAIGTR
jgi:hypothetical protein